MWDDYNRKVPTEITGLSGSNSAWQYRQLLRHLTYVVYFFVRSKKYLSIQSKHAKMMKYRQLYGKMTTK